MESKKKSIVTLEFVALYVTAYVVACVGGFGTLGYPLLGVATVLVVLCCVLVRSWFRRHQGRHSSWSALQLYIFFGFLLWMAAVREVHNETVRRFLIGFASVSFVWGLLDTIKALRGIESAKEN